MDVKKLGFPILAALLALAALQPATARAGTAVTSIGPRVGFSLNPDQFVVGGQMQIGEVAPKITFDPNIELGFGDNVTLISFGLDMHYHLTLEDTDWKPYVGAGVALQIVSEDAPPPADNSDTNVGANLLIGADIPTKQGQRFFSEMKIGLADAPDLKLLVGWNFKL